MELDYKIEPYGKFEQLKEFNLEISGEVLEGYLDLNFKHLGLARQESQDKDVSLITWFAKKKFIGGIDIFTNLKMIPRGEPTVLPYVLNVVGSHSPKIPLQSENFKGKLFHPQASLLNRMMELENHPPVLTSREGTSMFPMGIVSERLSFGKSFCLPALICHKFYPGEIKEANTSLSEFITEDPILPINLVVCGTKVSKEWKKNLESCVGLSFLVVELQKQLSQLSEMVSKKDYPQILVVKDGDITFNGIKDKALSHVQTILGTSNTFARAIYDDFDMLKFERNSRLPNALFSWFVSGTSEGSMPSVRCLNYKNNLPKEINLSQIGIILDSVASVECNKEYSSAEYNNPKVDVYHTCSPFLEILVNLVKNIPVEVDDANQLIDQSLLQGTFNSPYLYDYNKLKILVAMEDKGCQLKLISELNEAGIKAVKLTKANIDKFAREDTIVGVAGNLFGVNMGFLTHTIINIEDYAENAQCQIIGRGQRLNRKQNLQVYLKFPLYESEEER